MFLSRTTESSQQPLPIVVTPAPRLRPLSAEDASAFEHDGFTSLARLARACVARGGAITRPASG
jgi:hypothetical protein